MHILQTLLPAFLGGTVLSIAEYFPAKWVLKRHAQHYAAVSVIRQVVNVGYLAALFFFGRENTAGLMPLLIGGALGLTVPAIFLNVRLLKAVKTPDDMSAEERRDDNG